MSPILAWLVGTARAANPIISIPSKTVNSAANAGPADLASRIVDILSALAYPLAFAGIIYTAYILVTASGSPDGWTKAKKNLSYILTGFFLIFGAVMFVRLLRNVILTG